MKTMLLVVLLISQMLFLPTVSADWINIKYGWQIVDGEILVPSLIVEGDANVNGDLNVDGTISGGDISLTPNTTLNAEGQPDSCTLLCDYDQGTAPDCQLAWNGGTDTLVVAGTGTLVDFTDCFEVGDGVIAFSSGAYYAYVIRHITVVTPTQLTFQQILDVDLGIINSDADVTLYRLRPFQQIKSLETGEYIYTLDELGEYSVKGRNVATSGWQNAVYGSPGSFMVYPDNQNSTISYPLYSISTDIDHHNNHTILTINNSNNSKYGSFFGTERKNLNTGTGIVSQNSAIRVHFKDTSSENTFSVGVNNWHSGGIYTTAEMDLPGASTHSYDMLSAYAGEVHLKDGNNGVIVNGYGYIVRHTGDDGTFTNAIGFGTVPFTGTTIANIYGARYEDQTVATGNTYGTMLDDGSECRWSDGIGGTATCSETINLTATNVKALAATPITLIAAPGADRWVEIVSVVLILDEGGTPYDDAAADGNIEIEYDDGTDITTDVEADGFIDAGADAGRYVGNADIIYPIITTDIVAHLNNAVRISNNGAEFTGGDGTVDVKITYIKHVLGL